MPETLPFYNKSENSISDGIYFPLPSYCKNKYNEKCVKYYNTIQNQEGYHICPYGFTSFCRKIGSDLVVYTALRVYGKYNFKKVKPKIKTNYIHPVFSEEDFEKQLKTSEIIGNQRLKIDADIHDKADCKEFIPAYELLALDISLSLKFSLFFTDFTL